MIDFTMWFKILLAFVLIGAHRIAEGEDEPASVPDVCNMALTTSGQANEEVEVHCNCDSSKADCSDLGLTELPDLISFPKHVIRASFSGNHLHDITDDIFYSGPELSEMDLSHNDIEFFSVNTFTPFKKLHTIKMSHNRLTHIPADAFLGLSELRILDIGFNGIQNLFDSTFETLTVLQELDLRRNPLQELTPLAFQHLVELEALYLDSTMLPELPDLLFAHNGNLKVLSLANNLLTNVPTVALKQVKGLKHLDLSGNPIVIIKSEAFLSLDNLRVLHLDQMPQLMTIDAYAFGSLPSLTELHCSFNNKLTIINENAFVNKNSGRKISLEQLELKDNNLHGISPHLLKWTRNLELDLRNNPWHCDCQTQWLIPLKTRRSFQENLRCETPSQLHGRRLSELKERELPCGMSTLDIVLISLGSLLAVVLLVVMIGFFLHRRQFALSLGPRYRKPYREGGKDNFEYDRGMEL